jgi:hypothetical protein
MKKLKLILIPIINSKIFIKFKFKKAKINYKIE